MPLKKELNYTKRMAVKIRILHWISKNFLLIGSKIIKPISH